MVGLLGKEQAEDSPSSPLLLRLTQGFRSLQALSLLDRGLWLLPASVEQLLTRHSA